MYTVALAGGSAPVTIPTASGKAVGAGHPVARLLVAGAVCLGFGMGAIAEASAPALLLVGVALAGIAIGLTNPTLATIASERAGRERQGAILGVAQSSGAVARTVGPVWNGVLYTRLGPAAPFLAGVVTALVSVAVAIALQRRGGAAASDGSMAA